MKLLPNLLALLRRLRLPVDCQEMNFGKLTALLSPQVQTVTQENTGASNYVDKSRYKISPFYPC
ncbi:MAG: hypothetical protein SAK29_06585 [Scytonema sp. PMC 1069.18]|nr:hypothetical protein [Scytonema sp. PMC 1069.18]